MRFWGEDVQMTDSLHPHRGHSAGSLLHAWTWTYQIRYQNRFKCCNLSRFQHLKSGSESSLECKHVIHCLSFHEYAEDIIYGKLQDSGCRSNWSLVKSEKPLHCCFWEIGIMGIGLFFFSELHTALVKLFHYFFQSISAGNEGKCTVSRLLLVCWIRHWEFCIP